MQQPLAGKHVAQRGDHRTVLIQTITSGIGKHGPARDDHVGDDQPAQGGANRRFGQVIEQQMGRIEGSHLKVVDKRHTRKAVGAPQRLLTRLLPGTDQIPHLGDLIGQQIGIISVENPRGMQNQLGKEKEPHRRDQQQGTGSQAKAYNFRRQLELGRRRPISRRRHSGRGRSRLVIAHCPW